MPGSRFRLQSNRPLRDGVLELITGDQTPQRLRRDIAAEPVLFGLHKGVPVQPFQNQNPVTLQKLPVARAIGAGQKIGQWQGDAGRFARNIARDRDGAPQRNMRNAAVCRGQAAVGHNDRTLGRAASTARAPCPTPPFGRPGAAVGCQP